MTVPPLRGRGRRGDSSVEGVEEEGGRAGELSIMNLSLEVETKKEVSRKGKYRYDRRWDTPPDPFRKEEE